MVLHCVLRALFCVLQMRSAMTRQIQGLTAASRKKSVKQHYVDIPEADIANMLESELIFSGSFSAAYMCAVPCKNPGSSFLVTGFIIAGCCLLACATYRTAGGESYGAKASMGVLKDVFYKDEKKGKLHLAASQVAFAELGVSWHSHIMPQEHCRFPILYMSMRCLCCWRAAGGLLAGC